MLDVKELANFRFYKQPRSLPVGLWSEIFENLGLQPALIRDENLATREKGIRELQRVVQRELERVVGLQATLAQGVRLWNTPVFTDNFTLESERGAVVGSNFPGSRSQAPHRRLDSAATRPIWKSCSGSTLLASSTTST